MVMVTIRKEKTGDIQEIRRVNLFAFGREAEADVVDTLRESCPKSISLVAVYDNQVVGHILFTPVTVETKTRTIKGMGLAPMAVMPECQRQGIGSQLVKAGLDEIERAGYPFVIVLGHPEYYPRFGFIPASRYRIVSEYQDIPDGVFMILVFDETALKGASGVANTDRNLPRQCKVPEKVGEIMMVARVYTSREMGDILITIDYKRWANLKRTS